MEYKPKELTLKDAEYILRETNLKPIDPEMAGPLLLKYLDLAYFLYRAQRKEVYSVKAIRKKLEAIQKHAHGLDRALTSNLHHCCPNVYW